MKKRFLAFVMTLVLVLTGFTLALTSVNVSSATYVQDGDWKYEMPSQYAQEYYIASYSGNDHRVQIPALFQGKPVTKILGSAFLNKATLTFVEIPSTIESIGMNAFYGCTALTSITIPKSVSEMGNNAFYGCTSADYIYIADGTALKVIPRNAFSGCSSAITAVIPQGITTISDKAFLNCTSLASVTIYPSVESIGDKSFDGCSLLTIYGYSNTYAQVYALEKNIPFVSLGDYVIPTETTTVAPTTESTTVATETEPNSEEVIPTEPTSSADEPQPTVSAPIVTEIPTTAVIETTAPTETETTTTQPATKPAAVKYKIGDTDLSGQVTVKDATLIQKYIASIVDNLNRTQLFLANCDGVGDVNIKDATQIQKYCAGFLNILFVGTEVEF